MTLRWGLLSTAKINDRFLAGCADSDQMEVTAAARRDAERAHRYAQEHRIRTSHGTYEAGEHADDTDPRRRGAGQDGRT